MNRLSHEQQTLKLPNAQEAVNSIIGVIDAAGVPPHLAAPLLRHAASELDRRTPSPRSIVRESTLTAEALKLVPEELLVTVLAGGLDLHEAVEHGCHDASVAFNNRGREIQRGGDKEPKSWRK